MRLSRLRIDRLPGIDEPYEIGADGPGVYVISGPNGVGKSSICRAVEALFWSDSGPGERTYVTAEFEIDGKPWVAERDGPHVRWRSDGVDRISPVHAGSHHRRSFFLSLRDLLDPSRDGTRDIAAEIRRQMWGGFDLAAIRNNLFPAATPRTGYSERKELNSARELVQQAEGRQAELGRRAGRRAQLVAEQEQAATAASRLHLVERAHQLAVRTEEHAEERRELGLMPPVLARLSEEEVPRVEQFRKQIGELDDRNRQLRDALDAARTARREAHLPAPIDDADLATWRERADELARLELELKRARTEWSASRGKVEAALQSLGGSDLEKAAFTLDDHAHLFRFLREAEENRTGKRATEWRLNLLKDAEEKDRATSDANRREDLRSAVDTLRRWLRFPDPGAVGSGAKSRRRWLILALGAVLVGAGVAWVLDPRAGFLLVGAGIGSLLPLVLVRPGGTDAAARTEARLEFQRIGIPPPGSWDISSVEARLRTLESEVARADAAAQRAEYAAADRQHLKTDLDAFSKRDAEIDRRRAGFVEDLDLGSMHGDAELVDAAVALDRLRKARIAHGGAAAEVTELEAAHAGLLAGLAGVLRAHGQAEPEDAAAAKAHLGVLSGRSAKLAGAIDEERRVTDQRRTVAADRDTARSSAEEIYAKASLEDGDLAGLRSLIGQLETFRALERKVADLESRNAADREALADAGESGLAGLDTAALAALKNKLSTAAGRAQELQREIAKLDAEVEEARCGRSLQELIARREEARAALGERRDEVLLAEAGRFLVGAAEREYEQKQMPLVFERARAHFAAFTHHGYELRIVRDSESPRLFAVDLRGGGNREVDELSDGTRAQLLMAARIAFAEEVEQGLTLPLFLDEALDQSDPARFEAIVQGLGRIADGQRRQIFYLTSDPLDGERMRRALAEAGCADAREINLGDIRRGEAAVKDLSVLEVLARQSLPEPAGVTPAEYAGLLGVPPFRPGRGHGRQHLFYLLSDDLPLLRTLLEHGVERVGQWSTVAGSALSGRLESRWPTASGIGVRVRLLEVFCDAWSQGKGRPVDRDGITDSGAVTRRYLNDVIEVAREVDGDPVRLLELLRNRGDPRLRGFRAMSAEGLEDYLRDCGYLDDRPELTGDELRVRALTSPLAAELPDGVARKLLDSWLEWAAKHS
ncbi:MAG: hypothetical protein OXT72_00770 [Gammaproteobacteria bacterium]|nr:hypothetical protein [Gammaproteobacteria bacterium]MDE0247054.1 hypothetical protein [Gammaproteobacteria bacterium]